MEEFVTPVDLSKADSREIAAEIVRVLHKKLARNIQWIYAADSTVITDYYVVCNGRSSTHVRALARDVEDEMAKHAVYARKVEGAAAGEWVLVDFGDVIVHVFTGEASEFYRFERLFKQEAFLSVAEVLPPEDSDEQ